jgi:hypothetical protein
MVVNIDPPDTETLCALLFFDTLLLLARRSGRAAQLT